MAKKFNSVWPPPVYVAQFADGSTFAPAPEPVQLRSKRRAQSDLDKALALLARLSAGDRAVLRERMVA